MLMLFRSRARNFPRNLTATRFSFPFHFVFDSLRARRFALSPSFALFFRLCLVYHGKNMIIYFRLMIA